VHELEDWLIDNRVDLVDMEAYAIAHVCKQMNVNFVCYKYITDYVGTPNQADAWRKNVAIGAEEMLSIL
jgi:adenosylhomocysteine nucleosidase